MSSDQMILPLPDELVVDLFAGGGGASLGIEWGLGRPVDVAVNHDPEAVAQHQENHPSTSHYCESVFNVDPVAVTRNQPVGLLWASPDCKHFSKAKGGRPVSKKIRGLAWVVVRWARAVRPRVIMLENVEEFRDWGPVTADGKPCPKRKGQTFQQFKQALERQGYTVEHRELRACDYGAPTIRKRLFLVARRDGLPIVWPEPTHGDPNSDAVKRGKLKPWRTAAECIDWSLPCPSIFDRPRPLADNTMKRIARGIQRFVLETPEPFIVTCNHGGEGFRGQGLDEPMKTLTAARDAHGLVVPYFVPRHGERDGQEPRTRSVEQPMPTVTATANGAQLVAAFMAKHYGGNYTGPGSSMREPVHTVTTTDHNAVVAAHLMTMRNAEKPFSAGNEPMHTVTANGAHKYLVAALMAPYYGSGSGLTGRDMRDPSPTIPTKDRLQLITVQIDGETYVLTDIGMRMLTPRELYRAQGFPDSYRIEIEINGRRLPKSSQVRMCGNSVSPVCSAALVAANFAHEQKVGRAT